MRALSLADPAFVSSINKVLADRFWVVGGLGPNNDIKKSGDGLSWTDVAPHEVIAWKCVTYGNGLFVAGSESSEVISTSSDGINWTVRSRYDGEGKNYGYAWWSVCALPSGYGFIAVGDSLGISSSNGTSWGYVTMPSGSWRGVCFDPSSYRVVAVSMSGKIAYAWPWDLNNWTEVIVSGVFRGVAAYGGRIVAVGHNCLVATSTDGGATWETQTLQSDIVSYLLSVTYGNGTWLATEYGRPYVWTSTDGVNWTSHQTPNRMNWVCCCAGGGLFLIGSNYNQGIQVSSDCVNWAEVTWSGVSSVNGICYKP
jgi:hypothetical protein